MNSDLEKFGRFPPYCMSVLLLTKDDNDESLEIRNANKVDPGSGVRLITRCMFLFPGRAYKPGGGGRAYNRKRHGQGFYDEKEQVRGRE